jgi:signal peptidase I
MSAMVQFRSFLRKNGPLLLVTLAIFAGRSSLADHYVVPSSSMEHTLLPGDRVLVNKYAFGLRVPFTGIVLRSGDSAQPGDIVIFDSPDDETRLIKRVVAVGGDRVELVDGRLRINGRPQVDADDPSLEHFAAGDAHLNLAYGGGSDFGPSVVPPGHVLVLGDARGNSRDGRSFGTIPEDELYARAFAVYYRSGEGFVWRPL